MSKQRKHRVLAMVGVLTLGGCVAPGGVNPMESYDLGPVAGGPVQPVPGLREVRVESASWLESRAIQYRLNFDHPARRQSYTAARWVAPPAELLQRYLERRLVGEGGRCVLKIELNEWVQVFASPQQTAATIVIRARLLSLRGETLATRHFDLTSNAVPPNSRGAVAGAGEAVRMAERSVGAWLAGETELAQSCRRHPLPG